MQLSQTDRKLIEQSAALADAHQPADLRAFLAANGSTYADSPDLGIVYAAVLGIAQSNLRSMADLVTTLTERETARA